MLVRPLTGRRVAGVAAGLAQHLGMPVGRVRAALVLLALVAGFGVALYATCWLLAPDARDARPDGPRGRPDTGRWIREHRQAILGAGLVATAATSAIRMTGTTLSAGTVIPVLTVLAGLVIAWSQLDAVRRARLVHGSGLGRVSGRMAAARVAAGILLVGVGVVLLVGWADVTLLWSSLLAALAVLAGTALVLTPWAVRLWSELGEERAALAREQQRAEFAAHIHDSVLQTLALIQRRSGDAGEVARLARSQERDLRAWLYGSSGTDDGTVGTALRAVAAEVEDGHGATVDVVVVGDLDERRLDRRSSALVQACREALLNAARHGGGAVSVYAEADGPGGLEVFVRDRGPGFDLEAVPGDRLGVRESILGRMQRAGGRADVRSAAGGGTEVVLRLPALPAEQEGEVAR
ncbi:signal transduction histidine kinase [Kineococcus xinjiangensis]|uniref:Signal transduction histidine kinase n=1 Tax=Kineococcus xinjiangensis TaxID=512762 RepID=A0A2S6IG16_9ACTN|nr:signal transduction histidine kinase [Kineococcus xinjiangensis]